jgi:hypothetical protein
MSSASKLLFTYLDHSALSNWESLTNDTVFHKQSAISFMGNVSINK